MRNTSTTLPPGQTPGLNVRSGLSAGTVTVYGTKSCPWTVKQLNYFDQKGTAYNFVDCSTQSCPSFVKGFPTVDFNGQTKVGYKEY